MCRSLYRICSLCPDLMLSYDVFRSWSSKVFSLTVHGIAHPIIIFTVNTFSCRLRSGTIGAWQFKRCLQFATVKMLDAWRIRGPTKGTGEGFFVFEYHPLGDLRTFTLNRFDADAPFTEDELYTATAHLVLGLNHFHCNEKGFFIHR